MHVLMMVRLGLGIGVGVGWIEHDEHDMLDREMKSRAVLMI